MLISVRNRKTNAQSDMVFVGTTERSIWLWGWHRSSVGCSKENWAQRAAQYLDAQVLSSCFLLWNCTIQSFVLLLTWNSKEITVHVTLYCSNHTPDSTLNSNLFPPFCIYCTLKLHSHQPVQVRRYSFSHSGMRGISSVCIDFVLPCVSFSSTLLFFKDNWNPFVVESVVWFVGRTVRDTLSCEVRLKMRGGSHKM